MAENNYDLEYTGSMVDRILDTGYDLQNQGYIFRGLASHYTGTPTERTWLIAPTGSTGFGLSSPVTPGSIGICMYNGSSWSAEVLNTLTLDSAPTAGSGNGITSGAVKTLAESITNAIGQLEQSVSDRFTSLELEDTTGSLQAEVLSITLKYVFEGETEALTSLSILAATSEKAGLMSAADKQKLDAFVTNIRSLRIQDTTAQADQGTEITNTLKWTIGGVTEAITAFTLYAATTSKAGLMSAADKTALDTLPSLINAGYLYAGIATPSTVPSSTSAKIYYIAIDGGTYTNFGNLNVTQGINIIYKSGDAWSVAQVVGIDNEPTAGSDNLVKSGGVKTELALGAVYDVSAHHNGATFESLSALLSDTDLNALIPTDVRKGGMSIKFVQSSDNKYIQARCMAQIFTTDTTQWSIAEEGVYVDNPEFVYVKTDKDGKILWAINTDGNIYYGAGIPQQVIDYIEERLAEFSLDEYEDIVAFLNDLEKGDSTLQDLLDKKVDGEYVENPEYIEAKIDSENKIIEATKNNGTKIFSVSVETPAIDISGNVTETQKDLEERLAVLIDSKNRIVSYREKDGTLVENAGIKTEFIEFLKEEQYNKHLINAKVRTDSIVGSDIKLLYPKETMEPILRNLKFANNERNGRFVFNGTVYRFQPYTPITFIWFTDIHDNTENLQRIRDFRNAYKDYIDDVVFTGDVMDGMYINYDSAWFHNNNTDDFLFVIGNHDAAETLSPYKPVSPKMCYEKYLAQYLSSTNIICGTNKNYWYKDYPTTDIPVADLPEGCPSGIRFIAIDQYHWKEGEKFGVVSYDDGSIVDAGEQKEWLTQVLADAKANNYAVIAGMHGSAVDTIGVECSFDDFEKFGERNNYANTDTDILDTIQEFIDNGGIFITWLCGHWHQDWFGNIRDYPAQTQIVANTASYTMKYRNLIRYKDTKSMDLFNVISVDPYLSHIRLMRIGADFDRHGRHIGKMVYDYKNKKLISNY